MSNEKIGVIIPFYGLKQKLFRTLESVERQLLAPDFVVLIDDCGPDPVTPAELEGWKERLPQLIFLQNEQNIGAGFTRNVGMDYLEGKAAYVHFLDSDDEISDGFYEKLYQNIKKEPNLIAVFAESIYKTRGSINHELTESSLFDGIFKYRRWATSAILWRYSFIKRVRFVNWKSCEDSIFDIEAGLINAKIKGVLGAIAWNNQENDPITNKERNKASEIEKIDNRVNLFIVALNKIPLSSWLIPKNIKNFSRTVIDLNFKPHLSQVRRSKKLTIKGITLANLLTLVILILEKRIAQSK